MPVSRTEHRFDDSVGYESFMARWTAAVGSVFLGWVAPPPHARWLDVGCGTGVFTQLILDSCSPSTVHAVDNAQAQINHAQDQRVGRAATFQVADAQALPFPDAGFDVVASALVINFISDRPRAISEMRRVISPHGLVAGYVWDWAAERSPSWPLRVGLREIGSDVPQSEGAADSRLFKLASMFESAGFVQIETRSIDVKLRFPDFGTFWNSQTPSYSPLTHVISALSSADHGRLTQAVRAGLPVRRDGSIECSARANCIKAHAPG
jgi:SAM-dependent methyltransferase